MKRDVNTQLNKIEEDFNKGMLELRKTTKKLQEKTMSLKRTCTELPENMSD